MVDHVRTYLGVVKHKGHEFIAPIHQPVDAKGNACGPPLNNGRPCPPLCD